MSDLKLKILHPIPDTQRVAFATPADWNNWFTTECYVTVNGSSINAATYTLEGTVKKAYAAPYSFATFSATYTPFTDAENNTIFVPSQLDYDRLKTAVEQLSAAFITLRNAMISAGQLGQTT